MAGTPESDHEADGEGSALSTRRAVLFPGQGTQAPEMGRPWLDHPSWAVVEQAEAVLDRPLAPLLLDADDPALATTEGAQIAVFVTSLMAWRATGFDEDDVVAFAGHSLGQLTALVASGTLTFDGGIRLVAERAAACQQATEDQPGTMAALLGASDGQVEASVDGRTSWLANDNGGGQFVIGGTPAGVIAASARAQAAGVRRVAPLPVAGAFHTPLMEPAAYRLAQALTGVEFREPSRPVISNDDGGAVAGGEGWPARLVAHLVRPVRWSAVMSTLGGLGVEHVVEVGPGTTLASLARRNLPGVGTASVTRPDQVEVRA